LGKFGKIWVNLPKMFWCYPKFFGQIKSKYMV